MATGTKTRTLPKAIHRRLRQLRGLLRRMILALGLARTCLLVLALVVLSFILDRTLESPTAFRATLLVISTGLVVGALYRFILKPLVSNLGDERMALLLEEEYPELEDQLISAVQFSRMPAEKGYNSKSLIGAVIDEAEEKVQDLDVRPVVESGSLFRIALGTMILAVAVAGLFYSDRETANIWFKRNILLQNMSYPRTVYMTIDMPPEVVVARGDDLTVRAELKRGNPLKVLVHSFPVGDSTLAAETVPMAGRGDNFVKRFPHVTEDFAFRVMGGDFKSQVHTVRVHVRPKIEEIKFWLDYPDYTRLAPTPEERPVQQSNLKVPVGTKIRFDARANRALGEATLVIGNEVATRQPTVEDDRRLQGTLTAQHDLTFHFKLTDQEEFPNPEPNIYKVRAIPDRLPVVRVPVPGKNREVSTRAVVPIETKVTDDYGIGPVHLIYWVEKAGADEPGEPVEKLLSQPVEEKRLKLGDLVTPRDAGPGDVALRESPEAASGKVTVPTDALLTVGEVRGNDWYKVGVGERQGWLPVQELVKVKQEIRLGHEFQVEPLELEPGDRIKYRIAAADFGNRLDGKRGLSELYQLTIVTDDHLRRMLQSRLKRMKEELQHISKLQEATKKETGDLSRKLSTAENLSRKQRSRLTGAELDQRRIQSRLKGVVDDADRMLTEKQQNRLSDEGDEGKQLQRVRDLVSNLAEGRAQRIVDDLIELRKKGGFDSLKLAGVPERQQKIITELDALIRDLEKWDEYNSVIRDLRYLLKIQKRIREQTKERAKKELGD